MLCFNEVYKHYGTLVLSGSNFFFDILSRNLVIGQKVGKLFEIKKDRRWVKLEI